MILKRIKNSFVYRISYVYEKLLSVYPAAKVLKEKEICLDYNLVILCGHRQLGLLREALSSVSKFFEMLPRIWIFTDKDLDPEICRKKVSWMPSSSLQIIGGKDCIEYHFKKGNNSLAEFAAKNPMGLKLAAILQILDDNKPLLYFDTDVLWFRDPTILIKQMISDPQISLRLSQDFQPAYDQNLVEKGVLNILLEEPFYCAGILFLKKFSNENRIELERLLKIANNQSNHFTEQTIFSYFNKINGNEGLNKHEFAIILQDKISLLPFNHKNLIARHYVGPVRHLFWRDAFFLKLGLIK